VKVSSHVDDDVGRGDRDGIQHEVTTMIFESALHRARKQCFIVRPFQSGMHTINVAEKVT